MCVMFVGASAFNQPLETWNTSRVTDMKYMFHNAIAFNQPLEAWDTDRVEEMEYMFIGATAFNLNQQPPAWLMK